MSSWTACVSCVLRSRLPLQREGDPIAGQFRELEQLQDWVPAPNGTFSLYIRAYWSEPAILDGTWMPPQVEKVK